MKFMPLTLAIALLPSLVWGHEVWLDPVAYEVESGAFISADLRNGEKFEGSAQPFNDLDFERFDRIHDGEALGVMGRLGNRPAFRAAAEDVEPGLHVVIYQSVPSTIHYSEWEKFLRFAAHKDFKDIEARHVARMLPKTGFAESYSRFAKTLIAVGDGAGRDAATGLETEIVALENPYTTRSDSLSFRVLYQNTPRASAQVELFERAPNGDVAITLHRTDENGEVSLPVKPEHAYLVDAVLLREPAKGAAEDTVWETLWASLTFAVPDRE